MYYLVGCKEKQLEDVFETVISVSHFEVNFPSLKVEKLNKKRGPWKFGEL
jgi:hypothetical protein